MTDWRPVTAEDCAFVQHCIEVLEEESFDSALFASKYRRLLEAGHYHSFIILHNNEACGLIGISIADLMHHERPVAEIQEFIVFENFRNQKIGEQILSKALVFAQELGCEQVELSSRLKREAAHRFYLNNGLLQTHYKFSFSFGS